LDEDALEVVSEHFRQIALKEGLPLGTPLEYDLFHFEHQVPGGMISNLTRQLREVGMEDRTPEILKEIIQVRKELGYPVMATPFSQIVGVQAMENIVSGKRYERIPDEVIKYALGLYGELNAPLDAKVMARIEQLPQTQEFKDWKPKGYDDPIEKIRSDVGPDLDDDDDLLLTILIPGYKKENLSAKPMPVPVANASTSNASLDAIPTEFRVEVDGEQFDVKVSPKWTADPAGENGQVIQKNAAPQERPAGAVVAGMAGLVISIDVNVGDRIQAGDPVAVIEAMKMMRTYLAPHSGVVKEVCVEANAMVDVDDILMVVEEDA
jgi:pyruvate carboxylase